MVFLPVLQLSSPRASKIISEATQDGNELAVDRDFAVVKDHRLHRRVRRRQCDAIAASSKCFDRGFVTWNTGDNNVAIVGSCLRVANNKVTVQDACINH